MVISVNELKLLFYFCSKLYVLKCTSFIWNIWISTYFGDNDDIKKLEEEKILNAPYLEYYIAILKKVLEQIQVLCLTLWLSRGNKKENGGETRAADLCHSMVTLDSFLSRCIGKEAQWAYTWFIISSKAYL